MFAFAYLPTDGHELVYVRYFEDEKDLEGGGMSHWEGWAASAEPTPLFDDEYMFDSDGNVWLFSADGLGDMNAKKIVGAVVEVLTDGYPDGVEALHIKYDQEAIFQFANPDNRYVFPRSRV
jgi:hypothetical protein